MGFPVFLDIFFQGVQEDSRQQPDATQETCGVSWTPGSLLLSSCGLNLKFIICILKGILLGLSLIPTLGFFGL